VKKWMRKRWKKIGISSTKRYQKVEEWERQVHLE